MKKYFTASILIMMLLGIANATDSELTLKSYLESAIKSHPLSKMAKADYLTKVKNNTAIQGMKDWSLYL